MRHSPQEIFNTAARWLEATGSTPYEARVVADHARDDARVGASAAARDNHVVNGEAAVEELA